MCCTPTFGTPDSFGTEVRTYHVALCEDCKSIEDPREGVSGQGAWVFHRNSRPRKVNEPKQTKTKGATTKMERKTNTMVKATKNTKCTTIWHLFQQFRRAKRSKKLRMKGCRVDWLVLQTKAARNFNFNLGSHWRLLLLEKSKTKFPRVRVTNVKG